MRLSAEEIGVLRKWKIEYRDYTIVVKLDFPQPFVLIDGMPCLSGYVVGNKNAGNIMPGATWFQTVKDAKQAIDVLIETGVRENGGSADSNRFWTRLRELRGVA